MRGLNAWTECVEVRGNSQINHSLFCHFSPRDSLEFGVAIDGVNNQRFGSYAIPNLLSLDVATVARYRVTV